MKETEEGLWSKQDFTHVSSRELEILCSSNLNMTTLTCAIVLQFLVDYYFKFDVKRVK